MSAYSIATRGLAGRKIPQGVLTPMNTLLFGSGEQGALYDPSDLSTLFQDSAGTTPVTAVEQYVGLILDKSRGSVLGPELVTGGGFDDPANWTTSTWTVSAGVATYPDTINDFIRPANANLLPLVAGKTYCVRFTLSGVTGSATCAVTNADGLVAYTAITSFTTNGEKQFIIYAANSTTNIRFYGYTSSGGTWSLDNISVRELPGNHATQATSAKRPKYSRRVNFLTESEFRNGLLDLSTSGGLLTGATLAGYAGAVAFAHDGVASSYAYKSATPLNGFSAILSVVVQMTDGGVPVASSEGADSDFMLVINGGASTAASVVSLGGGFYRMISQPTVITASNAGVVKYNTNSSRTFKVTAYDLRLAADSHLPYQRVNTTTDYDADPAKFPAYLRWDGVDDALQTGNIDFTGTDKMTVWAGVTRLTQEQSNVCELSNTVTNNGMFYSGISSGNYASFISRGTGGDYPNAYSPLAPPPVSAVIGGAGSIGDQISTARVNGVSINSNLNQGTGNYGNYPLYIGARAGTSLFFNGRLYSLIVRGAQSSLSQIEAVETLIRQKMRLP